MCNHAPFSRREDLDNHKKHVHGQMGDGGEDDEAEVFYTASDHSGGAENWSETIGPKIDQRLWCRKLIRDYKFFVSTVISPLLNQIVVFFVLEKN